MPDIQIPQYPSTTKKTLGKDYLLFVAEGTFEDPIWNLVGGQRGASLNMSAEEIDVSDKTSDGWGDTVAGMKNWSLELDAILVLDDKGVAILKQCFLKSVPAYVMRRYADGRAEKGWVSVTDFSDETAHEDAAGLTGTLNGKGAPEFVENEPDPLNPVTP